MDAPQSTSQCSTTRSHIWAQVQPSSTSECCGRAELCVGYAFLVLAIIRPLKPNPLNHHVSSTLSLPARSLFILPSIHSDLPS